MQLTNLEKCVVFDTATRRLQDNLNEFMALNPTEKIFDIVLDYLHNDEEVQQYIAYVQSEEFPKIHTVVQYLKQYKNVSVFMYMNLKPKFDRNIISSFSTGG